jgi:DNA-binding transcriptional ArsR family regulator
MGESMGYVAAEQDPFRAIADPGRRMMLDALLEGERSVGELVGIVGLSQATVSQHLKVLRLAGLVEERRAGRQNFYAARGAELQVVADWVAQYEAFWSERLDRLGALLDRGVQ